MYIYIYYVNVKKKNINISATSVDCCAASWIRPSSSRRRPRNKSAASNGPPLTGFQKGSRLADCCWCCDSGCLWCLLAVLFVLCVLFMLFFLLSYLLFFLCSSHSCSSCSSRLSNSWCSLLMWRKKKNGHMKGSARWIGLFEALRFYGSKSLRSLKPISTGYCRFDVEPLDLEGHPKRQKPKPACLILGVADHKGRHHRKAVQMILRILHRRYKMRSGVRCSG